MNISLRLMLEGDHMLVKILFASENSPPVRSEVEMHPFKFEIISES